ncbi:MAG: solute carrier family 23 protein [Clostridia bacterium]|nr:solute carrier family 23 protein [Clostridia bacterium]
METRNEGIYDGFKQLGTGKMMVLGLQHVFAMFGATVLVPILTGLSVSVTLLCAGLGTLWFYFITKRKIPIFLGSSFAFLAAFGTIAPFVDGNPNMEMLPYATLGVFAAGLIYVVLAILFKIFGAKRIMKLFPPVVTGPIIVLIGLNLAGSAIANAQANWILAIIAIAIIICVNLFGKGMIKILPILIGIIGSYLVALLVSIICGPNWLGLSWMNLSSTGLYSDIAINGFSDIIAIPPVLDYTPFFGNNAVSWSNPTVWTSIITFVVVAVAAMVEHIGDICAIGATCGKNFIKDPGLTRTLLGDGIGTSLAGFLGGPANTTYSENTGVVALTKVYDPKVMLIAACMTLVLSFVAIFETFIQTIPTAIIGGISIVLYGMISATGVRTIVENKVDFKKFRNIIVAALILVAGLGFATYPVQIPLGDGYVMSFGGLACAAVIGIVINAILPGKDYEFDADVEQEKAEG